MSAVPAGYAEKVKCTSHNENEPPAAPKGWQYVKQTHYTTDGILAAVCCCICGGCCYMCAREQKFWQLTPAESVQPDYHVPSNQPPAPQAIVQGQPAVGVPV